MIVDSVWIILLFGLMGIVTNWIAKSRGYYVLPQGQPLPLDGKRVSGVFAIYLGIMLIVAPYLSRLLIYLSGPMLPPVGLMNAVQLLVLLSLAIGLFLFCRSDAVIKKVWKNSESSIWTDISLGILSWLLAFPLVAVIGQFCDLLIYLVFGVESYEQVAVRYLKTTLESPSQMVVALATILVIAPTIEEFLFRGCLQTYFKRHMGTKAGILLASFCFALFHFSASQGIGNISLLASLFSFACFLGFVYERQRSLFASIGLHATFNFASTLRIIFFPEG